MTRSSSRNYSRHSPSRCERAHAESIRAHRLRNEIIGTKVANRLVNRLGPGIAFDMTEEEGASLQQVVSAFLVAERLLDLDKLWKEIEEAVLPETVRIELFSIAAACIRAHLSDILRAAGGETQDFGTLSMLEPGVRKIASAATKLIRSEVRNEAAARRDRLLALGASDEIVRGLVRLYELDGVFGIAALAARQQLDELSLTRAYTRLGEALGLDWAQQQVARFAPGRSMGAPVDRGPGARLRAAQDRIPFPMPRQGSRRVRGRVGCPSRCPNRSVSRAN